MRRLTGLAAVTLWLVAASAPASAAEFERCGGKPDAQCARVAVPLDRSGAVPGQISLHVERVRARRLRRGAIFAFAGGPGQAAAPLTLDFAEWLDAAMATRDLIVFDQRGTGRSGLLRCPGLERANILSAGREAAECARSLGPRRAHYTTRDSVEDIEAVRRELGVERISLYGVSYGTKVVEAYAIRYPQHVERLVLDSVVLPEGFDPLYLDAFEAVPRILRALCAGACRKITPDPRADVAGLVARMRGASLQGYLVGRDGRRHVALLDSFSLFSTLASGDFDPALRAATPGAVRAALAGDLAPILRLKARSEALESPDDPRLLSAALYAATSCEELPLPWHRTAPPEDRMRQAGEHAAGYPDSAFAPFDRAAALRSDTLALCQAWPAAAADPAGPPGPFSRVPTLILAGEDDLRTPLEGALRLAERMPGAEVVSFTDTGHGVVGADLSGCVGRVLERFFRGRSVGGRCYGDRLVDPLPPPPTSISQVPPARGVPGSPGRTLAAVLLAFDDTFTESLATADVEDPETVRGGGLRGGRFSLRVHGLDAALEDLLEGTVDDEALEDVVIDLRMDRVQFVPGVQVTGRVLSRGLETARGSFRVGGRAAARGTLSYRATEEDERLTGRLGGRRVRFRRALPATDVSAGAATGGTTTAIDALSHARAALLARLVAQRSAALSP